MGLPPAPRRRILASSYTAAFSSAPRLPTDIINQSSLFNPGHCSSTITELTKSLSRLPAPIPTLLPTPAVVSRNNEKRYHLRRVWSVGGAARCHIGPMLGKFPSALAGAEERVFGGRFVDQIRHPGVPPGFDLASTRISKKVAGGILQRMKRVRRGRRRERLGHTGYILAVCNRPIAFALYE